jgi:hypothetical protein
MEIKNSLLNDQWVTERSSNEMNKFPRFKWEWRQNLPESVWYSKDSLKREFNSHDSQHQKIKEISDKQSDDSFKTIRKNQSKSTQKGIDGK